MNHFVKRQASGNIVSLTLLSASKNNLWWPEFNGMKGWRWGKIFTIFLEEGGKQEGNILRQGDESMHLIFLWIQERNPHWVSLLANEPVNSHWNALPKGWHGVDRFKRETGGFAAWHSPTHISSGCLQRKAVRADEPDLSGLQPEQVLAPWEQCDFSPLLNKTHNKLFSLKLWIQGMFLGNRNRDQKEWTANNLKENRTSEKQP